MNIPPPQVEPVSFDPPMQQTRDPKIGVAPLVDIVLLLICFYLLVSNSIQSHQDRTLVLPRMSNKKLIAQQPAELIINVPQEGPLKVNNRILPFDQLPNLLRTTQQRAREKQSELRVVIRADSRQRFERLQRVLTICRQADLPRILLRVREPEHEL